MVYIIIGVGLFLLVIGIIIFRILYREKNLNQKMSNIENQVSMTTNDKPSDMEAQALTLVLPSEKKKSTVENKEKEVGSFASSNIATMLEEELQNKKDKNE